MKIGKMLLIKAFLVLAGVFGANGINKADASSVDVLNNNENLSNVKLEGTQYAGCIFDDIAKRLNIKSGTDSNSNTY